MNISMSDAQRSKDETKRINAFSKLWNKGETWMVFYPLGIFGEGEKQHADVIVNTTFGNKINDFNGIGIKRAFIPFNGEVVDGAPKHGCLANDFARIARAILKGDEQLEIEKAKKNKMLAKSAETLALKIAEIHEKYKNERPSIGGFTKIITTECVGIKLNSEGVPDPQTAALASQELSADRIAKFSRILKDPNCKFTVDDKYLVVTYAFGVQERKQEAGNVDPQGVKPEDRPEIKYPEIWNQFVHVLESMASDSTMIAKRNSNFTPVDDDVLISALASYIVDKVESIEAVTDAQALKGLKASIKTLKVLGIDELPNVDMSADEGEVKKAAEEEMEADVSQAEEEHNATTEDTIDNAAEADQILSNLSNFMGEA